jgi:abortive infection bacteriophage resistance protein
MVKEYKAHPLTIPEQIILLQEKGLTILPENNAEHWLSHIGYFRLKNYTNKFKNPQTGDFVANSTFEQVINLYLFDRDLRFVLFDAIETIEIAIKALMSNSVANIHGPHWYMERSNFTRSI